MYAVVTYVILLKAIPVLGILTDKISVSIAGSEKQQIPHRPISSESLIFSTAIRCNLLQ